MRGRGEKVYVADGLPAIHFSGTEHAIPSWNQDGMRKNPCGILPIISTVYATLR